MAFHSLPRWNSNYLSYAFLFNPFTPKSDQFQISPAASPEILHYTGWRTWLSITILLRWKMIILPILTTSLYILSWEGWENVLFGLGSERVPPTILPGMLIFTDSVLYTVLAAVICISCFYVSGCVQTSGRCWLVYWVPYLVLLSLSSSSYPAPIILCKYRSYNYFHYNGTYIQVWRHHY